MILKSLKKNFLAKEIWPIKKLLTGNMSIIFIVLSKFEMNRMKDYHYLYLKCEILLLANVFEKMRNKSLNDYGLCPSHT